MSFKAKLMDFFHNKSYETNLIKSNPNMHECIMLWSMSKFPDPFNILADKIQKHAIVLWKKKSAIQLKFKWQHYCKLNEDQQVQMISLITESQKHRNCNYLSPFTASTPAIISLCPEINLVAECMTISAGKKNQTTV